MVSVDVLSLDHNIFKSILLFLFLFLPSGYLLLLELARKVRSFHVRGAFEDGAHQITNTTMATL